MWEENENTCFIKFNVDENEYISIDIPHTSIEEVHIDEEFSWFYHAKNSDNLRIVGPYHCWIQNKLERFINHLLFILRENNELDLNVFPNIGYQWNEHLCSAKMGSGKWAGEPYLCFSSSQPGDPETFMYTQNGVIYLELTPTYPWLFGMKPKGLKKISFKQFLANYKPLVRTTISRTTAEQWLATAQELRAIIDRNEGIMRRE